MVFGASLISIVNDENQTAQLSDNKLGRHNYFE